MHYISQNTDIATGNAFSHRHTNTHSATTHPVKRAQTDDAEIVNFSFPDLICQAALPELVLSVMLTGIGGFLPSQSLPAPCSLNFPFTGLQSPLLLAPLNTRPPSTKQWKKGEDMEKGLEVDILSHTHYNSLHGSLSASLTAVGEAAPSLRACQWPPFSWTCHLPCPQPSPLVQLSISHLSRSSQPYLSML